MTDQTDLPSTNPPSATHNADDLLPPVQPPAATFIMQLFLIPLLIVSVIVGIWMVFSWVANRGTQPTELVNDIEHLNHASWQKALTLANTLRDPRYEYLREDPALAGRVSSLLESQLESEATDRDNLWLQIYLCRVLGEFKIDVGLPTLLKAANRAEPVEVSEVRRSALQALGLLIDRIGSQQALKNDQLLPTLIATSQVADLPESESSKLGDYRPHRLRSTSAFVLGLLDDPSARDQLAKLLEDKNSDVQFNAAVALARLGDVRCVEMLNQMLDPDESSLTAEMDGALPEPEQQKWLQWKRDLIAANALRGIGNFASQSTALTQAGVVESVKRVAAGGQVSEAVRADASQLLKTLQPVPSEPANATGE